MRTARLIGNVRSDRLRSRLRACGYRLAVAARSHVIADRSAGRATDAGPYDCPVLAGLLTYGGTGAAADRATDNGAFSAAALTRRSRTERAAGRAADNGSLVAAYLLSYRSARCRTKTAAERGLDVVTCPAHRYRCAKRQSSERDSSFLIHVQSPFELERIAAKRRGTL